MLDAGDPAGAARVAGEILAARPQNADVQGLLALALDEASHKEEALDAMRLAVALPAAPAINPSGVMNMYLGSNP